MKENRDQSFLGVPRWDGTLGCPPLLWRPALGSTSTHAHTCRTPVWGLVVTLIPSPDRVAAGGKLR